MKMREVEGSEFEIKADLVLLAMGFVSPVQTVLDAFGVDRDARGNVRANTEDYRTNVEKVFTAGDMRRGQSLVVWACLLYTSRCVSETGPGPTRTPAQKAGHAGRRRLRRRYRPGRIAGVTAADLRNLRKRIDLLTQRLRALFSCRRDHRGGMNACIRRCPMDAERPAKLAKKHHNN